MSVVDSILVALFLMVVVFAVLCSLYLFIEAMSLLFRVASNASRLKHRAR